MWSNFLAFYIFSYLDELWERLDNKPDFYDYDYEDYNTFEDVGPNWTVYKTFGKVNFKRSSTLQKALMQFNKFT